jgi:putative transposase
LANRVDRKLNSGNMIDVLSDLFIQRGIPSFIRSDNGPEFVAKVVQDWISTERWKSAVVQAGLSRYADFPEVIGIRSFLIQA